MKYLKALLLGIALLSTVPVLAKDKVSVMLDWFVNPDHAALVVAKQKGFFDRHDLDVELLEPADPSLPPKLAATGEIDIAVDTQPNLQMSVSEGLPLTRIGTLIATPLHALLVLEDSGIESLADLKGKTIGYTVSGVDENALRIMLASAGIEPDDVKLINVNWSLSPSLISGQVDAVNGAYRNFEPHNLAIEGYKSRAFFPEEHGVPAYDELILDVNNDRLDDSKFDRFLTALEEATTYTLNHPGEAWQAFIAYKPQELDNELNRRAWRDTLPRLALRPRALDNQRYATFAKFLQAHGLAENIPALADYAVQLPIR